MPTMTHLLPTGGHIPSLRRDNFDELRSDNHLVLEAHHWHNHLSWPPTAAYLTSVRWQNISAGDPTRATVAPSMGGVSDSESGATSIVYVMPQVAQVSSAASDIGTPTGTRSLDDWASVAGNTDTTTSQKRRLVCDVKTPDVIEYYDVSWQDIIQTAKGDCCLDLVIGNGFIEREEFWDKADVYIESTIQQFIVDSGINPQPGEICLIFCSIY